MIGLIHRVLFCMVDDAAGQDAVRNVKRLAGLPPDTVFRMNEHYPDDEFLRLFQSASDVLGLSTVRAEHYFSKSFMDFVRMRFPKWFEMCENAREFLELQPVIHNSFATGLQDPTSRRHVNDKFRIETEPDRMVVHYRSPNQLCGIYMTLAQMVIQHYGDQATVREAGCMKRGDPECVIAVEWFGGDGADA